MSLTRAQWRCGLARARAARQALSPSLSAVGSWKARHPWAVPVAGLIVGFFGARIASSEPRRGPLRDGLRLLRRLMDFGAS